MAEPAPEMGELVPKGTVFKGDSPESRNAEQAAEEGLEMRRRQLKDRESELISKLTNWGDGDDATPDQKMTLLSSIRDIQLELFQLDFERELLHLPRYGSRR